MVQDPFRLDVTLEPLDEYLVIQPTSDETETRAGLILPASAAAAAADAGRINPARVSVSSLVGWITRYSSSGSSVTST